MKPAEATEATPMEIDTASAAASPAASIAFNIAVVARSLFVLLGKLLASSFSGTERCIR
jgi:hypothetical protein